MFSCAKGHHIWIDEDLCFAKLPELDFLHLKYDKKAAIEYLKTIKKFQGHEERMAYQAFDSHVINRKTIRQHIDEIFSSRFNQYAIDFWNLDKFPDDKALDTIRGKYGNMRYDVRGVAVTAFK